MANNIRVSSGNEQKNTIKVTSQNIISTVNATSIESAYHAERAREQADKALQCALEAKKYEEGANNIFNNIVTETQDSINDINNATTLALNSLEEEVETLRANTEVSIKSEGDTQLEIIRTTSEPIIAELSTVQEVANRIEDVVNISNNIDDILNKTVDVGQTITGAEGTQAKVENVGTQFAPVLDFTIPRGDKGDDGGMDATYDEATGTLSFYKETGTVLSPKWGKISGDITKQYDLANTYATKTYVNQAIASIPQFKVSIVVALPREGEKMVLYLVPKEGSGNDVYNEYVWIEEANKFEFVGSTAVDLTDYATKAEIGDIASILDEINGEIV